MNTFISSHTLRQAAVAGLCIFMPLLATASFELNRNRYFYQLFTGEFNRNDQKVDHFIRPSTVSGNQNQSTIVTEGGYLFILLVDDLDLTIETAGSFAEPVRWQNRVIRYAATGTVRYIASGQTIVVEVDRGGDEGWQKVNEYELTDEIGEISDIEAGQNSLAVLSISGSYVAIYDMTEHGEALAFNDIFRSSDGIPVLMGACSASFSPDETHLVVSGFHANGLLNLRRNGQDWSITQQVRKNQQPALKYLSGPKGVRFVNNHDLLISLSQAHGVMSMRLANGSLEYRDIKLNELTAERMFPPEDLILSFTYPGRIWQVTGQNNMAVVATHEGLVYITLDNFGNIQLQNRWNADSQHPDLQAATDLFINTEPLYSITVINNEKNLAAVYTQLAEDATIVSETKTTMSPSQDSSAQPIATSSLTILVIMQIIRVATGF